MIPIPGMAYVVAAAFIAGAYSTYKVMDWKQGAEEAQALKISREMERGGVAIANQADKDYITKLSKQKEASDARAEKFKQAMDVAGVALRRCAVSPDIVRLLNEPRAGPPAGYPPKPEPAAPTAQAGSDCAAVLETYQWNIDNVIEPNRLQIEGLQRFYQDVRRKFNGL